MLFQFRLADGQSRVLFSNLDFGLDAGIVGFALSNGLGNGDVSVGLCLGNGCFPLDFGDVVDTEVVNDAVLVREGLDVERNQFQTHFHQVGNGVLLNLFTEGFAVCDHLRQFHLADDFTHVAFQRVLNPEDNHILFFVQEEFGRNGHHVRCVTDFYLNRGVNFDVDVFTVWYEICGANIDRHHFQAQAVNPFKERDAHAGASDERSRFSETGDDDGRVRRGLDIAEDHDDNNQNDDWNQKKRHGRSRSFM